GQGSGQVTGFTVRTDNSVLITATLRGSTRLGSFTSTSAHFTISPSGSASGEADLTDSRGDTLDLGLAGSVRFAGPSRTRLNGNFRVTILSGTGLFLGATGSGQTSGTLNLSTGAFGFTFRGTARV